MASALKPNGIRIRDLRIQKGWPQEQLARIADVSPRTIQRLEAGGNSSFETLRCLAGAFEMEVHELLQPAPVPAAAETIPESAPPVVAPAKPDAGPVARCWPYLPFMQGIVGSAALVLLVTFGIRLSPLLMNGDPRPAMTESSWSDSLAPSADPSSLEAAYRPETKTKGSASILDPKPIERKTEIQREDPRMTLRAAGFVPRAGGDVGGRGRAQALTQPAGIISDESLITRVAETESTHYLSIPAPTAANRLGQLLPAEAGPPLPQAGPISGDPGLSARVGEGIASGYGSITRSFQKSGKNTAAFFAKFGSSFKKAL